ncbi:MAG: signal recognition particle protein [Steroidobacteraceae bacterium]
MFDTLTDRLTTATQRLTGRGRITEDNVAETLREVRRALLEADVALPVVREFIDSVREKAVGEIVQKSLTPGQAFIGILHEQLIATMGGAQARGLSLRVAPPQVVLLAGLQGAGKTTTAAKLARWFAETHGKRVLLVSTDVRRPAAVLQLSRLATEIGAGFHELNGEGEPVRIVGDALAAARRGVYDVLIVDTAGRLHVDDELMAEVKAIDAAAHPHERLFVVDAMAGQDAVNAARAFSTALPLTGVILTKADGDARGGAALSVRHITGQPIVFVGVGEKTEALEAFDADRMARRILGMGDVVALVEKVKRDVDVAAAEQLARKVVKGRGFDLDDLRSQLQQVQKMGGLAALAEQLPGQMKKNLAGGDVAERDLRRQIAIINSMTGAERRQPGLIDGSRRRRIAAGAGVKVQDVNRLMKQYLDMQRMMKSLKGGKMRRLLGAMGGAGKLPFMR